MLIMEAGFQGAMPTVRPTSPGRVAGRPRAVHEPGHICEGVVGGVEGDG